MAGYDDKGSRGQILTCQHCIPEAQSQSWNRIFCERFVPEIRTHPLLAEPLEALESQVLIRGQGLF